MEVALLVRQLLDLVGLESYPKTSGADGIHVLVPVSRRHTYAETREFASIVAATLARTHRELVTTEWSRAKRHGVLIDANQNREGATIASVYSVRPHPGAPVSAPLQLGRGRRRPRSPAVHDRGRPRPRRPARGPVRAGARRQAVAGQGTRIAADVARTDGRIADLPGSRIPRRCGLRIPRTVITV